MQSDYSSNLLIPTMEQEKSVMKKLNYLIKKVKYLEGKVINVENSSPATKSMEARIYNLEMLSEHTSKNRKDRFFESKNYVDIDTVKQISAQAAENTIGHLTSGIIHNCVEEQSKALKTWQNAQHQQISERLHQLEQENAQLKGKNDILSNKCIFLENKLVAISDSQEAVFDMRMARYREELQSTIDVVCKTVNEQLGSNLMLVYADKLDEFISDQLKTLSSFEVRQRVCSEDIIKIRNQLNNLETGLDDLYVNMREYLDQKLKDIASLQISWESKLEACVQETSGRLASERASAQEQFEHIQKSVNDIIATGSRSKELVDERLASFANLISVHEGEIRRQSEKIFRSLELVKKTRSKVREIGVHISDLSRTRRSLDNLLHDFDGSGCGLFGSHHFSDIIGRVVNIEKKIASLEMSPRQGIGISSTLAEEQKNFESNVENQLAELPSVSNAEGILASIAFNNLGNLLPRGAHTIGLWNDCGSSMAISRDNFAFAPETDALPIVSTGDFADSVKNESFERNNWQQGLARHQSPHSDAGSILPSAYTKDKELWRRTFVSDLNKEPESDRSAISLSGIILKKKVEQRKAFMQRLSLPDLF